MAIYHEDIVSIDLESGTIHRSFLAHTIGKADVDANRFGIRAFRGGVPVDLSGASCQGFFRNAEGLNIALTSYGTVSGNEAYVTLPAACYNVEGMFTLAIKLVGGGVTGTMRIVDGMVDNTNTSGAVAPTSSVPTYSEIIAQYDAMVAATAAANTAIADEFDAEEFYPAGKYVVNSGALYRLTADHAENVTWANTAKKATNIGDETAELYRSTEKTRNLWVNPEYDEDGVTFRQNNDGSVHVSGTPTSEAIYCDYYYPAALTSGNYVLSCRKKGTLSGAKRFFVCTRNSGNTGTQFIQMNDGVDYGSAELSSFAPYRCEIILFSDTTYDCDIYVQLESGTEATDYIPPVTMIDYEARNEIRNVKNGIGESNVLLSKAENYVDVLEITEKSKITRYGHSSGVVEHTGESVHYSIATASNGGFFTEPFSTDSFALQITNLSFDLSVTTGSVRVWLYGTTKSGGDYANVIAYATQGHNSISIDFAYYDVYTTLDIGKPIKFLVTNGGEEISDFTVSSFVFKSLVTSQKYAEEYTEAKLCEMLDNIAGMIPAIPEQTYIKSPDGNKWLLTISNTGEIGATKVTPHKSAFIGNSLLMGWSTFGMAASDDEHDYYYHVTSRIHELDNSASYTHLSNGNLEHSTNSTDFNTAWNAIKQYLTSDLDLICIQLGDNVNTSAKEAQFEGSGGSFETMVSWIHTNCPNTRLIWVGTWYPSIHNWLVSACESNNVEFVDILPLSTTENKAELGDVIHRTEDRTQTLTGTYSVSGSALNITVTIYGKTYNITIPSYTSVQNNNNGTFTMVAPYTVVDSTGVQSHPGDSGMLAIAKQILQKIGID